MAECLQNLLSAAAQGYEMVGREWRIVTPPITPSLLTPPFPMNPECDSPFSSLLADLTCSDRDILPEADAIARWQKTRENTQTWLDAVEELGVVIDPGEIEDIPLYDAPITQEVIDAVYMGESRDGYDFDVWEEEMRKRMRDWWMWMLNIRSSTN